MQITVNGESKDVKEGITVKQLLEQFNVDPRAVVVELNGEIYNKDSFDEKVLEPGSIIEVVSFVGGG